MNFLRKLKNNYSKAKVRPKMQRHKIANQREALTCVDEQEQKQLPQNGHISF